MRKNNGPSLAMFLMGLFSQTQIHLIGYLDISEAFCYVAGPIYFVFDWQKLRKHGFAPFLGVWFLCIIGAWISSLNNATPTGAMLRGIASPFSVFCLACVFHHILSQDFKAFRWFFLGAAISGIISIFVFQRGTGVAKYGEELTGEAAIESITGYSLFWVTQIGTWLLLPIQSWYLKTPKWYCVTFGLWFMLYGLFSAGSRSGLLVSALFLFLILIAGKTRRSMIFVKKHFTTFMVVLLVIGPLMTIFYKFAAVNGYMGEKAYQKYIKQTDGKSGLLNLLKGGRGEFFVGLAACIEKPIIGYGPWARDRDGFLQRYILKYGSDESLADYISISRRGVEPSLPGHSYVISFWLWFGVLGLICMLYTGWLYFTTLKNRMHVVPELYGYFAFMLPNVAWAWFFSPFGMRTSSTLLMVLCLFTKAIEEGRFRFVSDADMRSLRGRDVRNVSGGVRKALRGMRDEQ